MTPATLDSAADEWMGQIVDDYVERLGRGEAPDIEDYARQHPELAAVLRQMLPALALVHASSAGAQTPQDNLQPEGPLGDFRLVREVGRGGMGVVYEATQISLGRTVALKVLPFAGAMDKRQLQRFQNEARAAAALEHPHIVPIYAVGCERGVHFYAMKFIDGASLETLLQEMRPPRQSAAPAQTNDPDATGAGPRRPDAQVERDTVREPRGQASTLPAPSDKRAYFRRIAELGADAARGLEHAHEVGVVHRDIKPANLILDGQGKIWITDFGLAQIRADTRLTMTGDLVGTLRYMSPEQALAKRVIVDHRTDIYSLGAALYELLTLQPVYEGGDRQELLRQIAFEEPKPIRRHNAAIPIELDTIVLKALEKNPADRYATAKEMAEDMERFVRDEPIRARRPSLARRVRDWRRRHKPIVSGAAMLMLALLCQCGVFLWQRSALAQSVEQDLQEAETWQRQQQWAKASEAIERASGRIEGANMRLLIDRVEKLRREVALVAALDEAHLSASSVSDLYFDNAAADRAFRSAFADYGIDVAVLAVTEAAQRVRGSPNCLQLITALDHWEFASRRLPDADAKQLRAIAQLADDDPWRKILRDALAAKDRGALERLAEDRGVLDQPPTNLWLLGIGLRDVKSRAASLSLLGRAQQRYPANLWLNLEYGTQLAQKETATASVGFLRAAVALRQQSPVTHHNLAYALILQGKFLDAEEASRKAIELNPDGASAYVNLAEAFRKQKRQPEAVAACRKAIELLDNHSNSREKAAAYVQLGYALNEQGVHGEAEEAFRTAIKFQYDHPKAYQGLGVNQARQSNFPAAEEAFLQAIKFKNDYALAYINLGDILSRRQKLSESEKAYLKAIDLDPNSATAHGHLGCHYLRNKAPDKAEEAFFRALVLAPDDAEWYGFLGTARSQQGNLHGAAAAWRKSIELNPDDHRAYDGLINNLREQRSRPEVEAIYRKAIPVYEKELAENQTKFGRDHTHTLMNMIVLMDGYIVVGRDADARKLQAERVALMKAKLGSKDAERNFVRNWLVLSEPLPYEGRDGAKALDARQVPNDVLHHPRAGDSFQASGKNLTWKIHNSEDVLLDFRDLYGRHSDFQLTYAICYIYVDTDRNDLALRVGSDDVACLAVNGKEVYRQVNSRGLQLDEDEVKPIALRKGSNQLVFKVVNEGGPWEGSLHFVGVDGRPAEGLRFGLEPE